jgi:peptidylprolyl isomerase
MKQRLLGFAVLTAVAVPLFAINVTTQPVERTTPSGLKITDVKSGSGVVAAGDMVWVHYTGRLQSTGEVFDSSREGQPLQFPLGAGRVIKGWDEGIAGMKVGDQRKLVIPPDLAYGDRGAGDKIPPGATLVFDVELMGMVRGGGR